MSLPDRCLEFITRRVHPFHEDMVSRMKGGMRRSEATLPMSREGPLPISTPYLQASSFTVVEPFANFFFRPLAGFTSAQSS